MKIELDDADRLILYRLLKYLAPRKGQRHVCTFGGASIEARETWSRCGVPADATSWGVLIEYPATSWSVAVRMVWRDGDLHRPFATHAVVEKLYDDEDQYGGPAGVLPLFSDWLRSLPL